MARQATLRRMEPAEFIERVLGAARPAGDGGERQAAPEGHGQAGPAGNGAIPTPPEETLLALFDRGTAEDRRLARVLATSAGRHADRLRVVGVPAAGLREQIRHWGEARRSFDSFDFQRWPVVGLFRFGQLITTFHPRLVFPDDRLQEREEAEQLEIFLAKMVYYDPAQVKAQKNFELGAEA